MNRICYLKTIYNRYNDLTAGNTETATSDQTAVETNRQAVFDHPAVINNLNILRTIFGKLKGQHDNFKLEQVEFCQIHVY